MWGRGCECEECGGGVKSVRSMGRDCECEECGGGVVSVRSVGEEL